MDQGVACIIGIFMLASLKLTNIKDDAGGDIHVSQLQVIHEILRLHGEREAEFSVRAPFSHVGGPRFFPHHLQVELRRDIRATYETLKLTKLGRAPLAAVGNSHCDGHKPLAQLLGCFPGCPHVLAVVYATVDGAWAELCCSGP